MSRKRQNQKQSPESPKTVPLPRTTSLPTEPPLKFKKAPLMSSQISNIFPPPGFSKPLYLEKEYRLFPKPQEPVSPVPVVVSPIESYYSKPIQVAPDYRQYYAYTPSVPVYQPPTDSALNNYIAFLHNPHIWGLNKLNDIQIYNLVQSFMYFPG